jgi:phage terminase large subunit-like protein
MAMIRATGRKSSISTLPTKQLKLHAKQEEARQFLARPATHSLIYGGSRGGKTFLICRQIAVRAIKAPGSRHGLFRQKFNAARTSLWLDTLPNVMKLAFPGVRYKPHEQDGYLELWNGAEIWIGGLDDKDRVDKVLGREFATIFLNEASQVAYSSVLVARTRLAQSVTCEDGSPLALRMYYDLNPCGDKHWTAREFVEHKSPETGKPLSIPGDYQYMTMSPEDNRENLPKGYVDSLAAMPEKQRKRFYDGVYVPEIEGALWTIELLEQLRVTEDDVPPMRRVTINVDPSGASGPEDVRSDEIGITATGCGDDGHGYLLADYSGRFSPEQWASRVIDVYQAHGADAIVAEKNYGGDMVRAVIESQAEKRHIRGVRVILVTATRGKHIRAEPVSALYDAKLVHHVGNFPALEDQLTGFSTAGYMGMKSPDRADSAIWGFSELMVEMPDTTNKGLLDFAKKQIEDRRAAAASPAPAARASESVTRDRVRAMMGIH